ncbi:ankyrin repeat domain-containing protein, partial [Pseudomonas aeruginosa]
LQVVERDYFVIDVAYRSKGCCLEVAWTNDQVWWHFGVSAELYEEFKAASDKTEFYWRRVRVLFPARRKWRDLEELMEIFSDIHLVDFSPQDVNSLGMGGDRPLHLAAFWGDVEAIDLLAVQGAEVDAKGDLDATPLLTAVACGHVAAARRLLELGASPHTEKELGSTPARVASRTGGEEMKKLFGGLA